MSLVSRRRDECYDAATSWRFERRYSTPPHPNSLYWNLKEEAQRSLYVVHLSTRLFTDWPPKTPTKLGRGGWVSFVKIRSPIAEKYKYIGQSEARVSIFVYKLVPKTKEVKRIEYLLPVKFKFKKVVVEKSNISVNQSPGGHLSRPIDRKTLTW